jgi:hypothetical protein
VGTPCSQCQNGGLCVSNANQQIVCSCPRGFSGSSCEISSSQLSSTNIGLIAGLSVLGAVLLLVAIALIVYFCVYPRIKAQRKYHAAPSDISAGTDSQAKFDQNSTRLNAYWPRSPQRYQPQTYTPGDEETA